MRARAKSYLLYGVPNARLDHQFGSKPLARRPRWLWGRVSVYSPERNYYLIRNSLILWRRPYVPWSWVFRDARRTVGLVMLHILFIPPRFERLQEMCRGIKDAFKMT
jgi:rhamnosyltransferase